MLKAATRCVAWFSLSLAVSTGIARGQDVSLDDALDAMRQRTEIGASDQATIADWVKKRMNMFSGFTTFRERFKARYTHERNSQTFRVQFATQTAQVAAQRFASPDLTPETALSVAQVLVDMNAAETLPGLLAGLESSDAGVRYLCAKGLIGIKSAVAGDGTGLNQTIQALRKAGLAESDPVVLGRIYEALDHPDQVAAVFDTYLALFDGRLTVRRGQAAVADGAEIYAYEFFRTPGVVGSLNAEQKSQVVARIAVFLRMDAQRYNTADLRFAEIDKIERMLDGAEEILVGLAVPNGGNIRSQLVASGHQNRAAVLQEAYKWVGNPVTSQPGALNGAPWNVPIGAP